MVSDFRYRLALVVSLIVLFILFSAADDGYCTTTAAVSIGKDESYSCFEYWFNRYQSFIGAIATLLAAFVAYRAVQRQITLSERLAADQNEREADAARAALPLALSAVCEYSIECIKRLDAVATANTAVPPWPSYEAPPFPNSVISPLQDCVRHADRLLAKQISDLLGASQIQVARTQDLSKRLGEAVTEEFRSRQLQQGLLDAAFLFARGAALFQHARSGYVHAVSNTQDIRGAFIIARVGYERYETLEGWITEMEGGIEQGTKE